MANPYDLSQLLPQPYVWSLEPSVRKMLDICEQFLFDAADPALTGPRPTTRDSLHNVTYPLSLMIAAIGNDHPDAKRLADVFDDLQDLQENVYAVSRKAIIARIERAATQLAGPNVQSIKLAA